MSAGEPSGWIHQRDNILVWINRFVFLGSRRLRVCANAFCCILCENQSGWIEFEDQTRGWRLTQRKLRVVTRIHAYLQDGLQSGCRIDESALQSVCGSCRSEIASDLNNTVDGFGYTVSLGVYFMQGIWLQYNGIDPLVCKNDVIVLWFGMQRICSVSTKFATLPESSIPLILNRVLQEYQKIKYPARNRDRRDTRE